MGLCQISDARRKRSEPFAKQIAKLARQIAKAAHYNRDECDLLERDVTADLRFQLTMEYLHTDNMELSKSARKKST